MISIILIQTVPVVAAIPIIQSQSKAQSPIPVTKSPSQSSLSPPLQIHSLSVSGMSVSYLKLQHQLLHDQRANSSLIQAPPPLVFVQTGTMIVQAYFGAENATQHVQAVLTVDRATVLPAKKTTFSMDLLVQNAILPVPLAQALQQISVLHAIQMYFSIGTGLVNHLVRCLWFQVSQFRSFTIFVHCPVGLQNTIIRTRPVRMDVRSLRLTHRMMEPFYIVILNVRMMMSIYI